MGIYHMILWLTSNNNWKLIKPYVDNTAWTYIKFYNHKPLKENNERYSPFCRVFIGILISWPNKPGMVAAKFIPLLEMKPTRAGILLEWHADKQTQHSLNYSASMRQRYIYISIYHTTCNICIILFAEYLPHHVQYICSWTQFIRQNIRIHLVVW